MTYYHDLITEKSWLALQNLKREFDFILIGGWAVFLHTKGLKSRDVDIVCNYKELAKLKEKYELIKNERLKKYEIHAGEFDIDIYVPFYSDLGIPVADLEKMTMPVSGFRVPKPEVLLILKQKAWSERAHSIKGEKDKLDIIGLLKSGVDFSQYKILLKKYGILEYKGKLIEILKETVEAPELGLNKHSFARLKKDFSKHLTGGGEWCKI